MQRLVLSAKQLRGASTSNVANDTQARDGHRLGRFDGVDAGLIPQAAPGSIPERSSRGSARAVAKP